MDKITIVIRDHGKNIKAEFDGEGKCLTGSLASVQEALDLLAPAPLKADDDTPLPPYSKRSRKK